LWLGKRDFVRNLKKAGGINILLQQNLNTHEYTKDKFLILKINTEILNIKFELNDYNFTNILFY
jgi:hypothetical protein